MPSRWLAFFSTIGTPRLRGVPKWVAVIAMLSAIAIFGLVTAVWFKFGWTLETIDEPFLIFTTFVIIVGWLLTRIEADKENNDAREDEEVEE